MKIAQSKMSDKQAGVYNPAVNLEQLQRQVTNLTETLNNLLVSFASTKATVDDLPTEFETENLSATIGLVSQLTGTTATYEQFTSDKYYFNTTGTTAGAISINPGTVVFAKTNSDHIVLVWLSDSYFYASADSNKWCIDTNGNLKRTDNTDFKFQFIGGGAYVYSVQADSDIQLAMGSTIHGQFNFQLEGTIDFVAITAETATIDELTVNSTINGNSATADKATADQYGNVINSTYTTQSTTEGIEAKIPTEASADNQLADKDFVNSSISTNTATFFGSFDTYSEFQSAWGTSETKNDYAVVLDDETHSHTTSRYKYTGTEWSYEYKVNDTPFTAAQNAAINSGITSDLVSQIGTSVIDDTVIGEDTTYSSNKIENMKVTVVDVVEEGNTNAVSSNAVNGALTDLYNYDDVVQVQPTENNYTMQISNSGMIIATLKSWDGWSKESYIILTRNSKNTKISCGAIDGGIGTKSSITFPVKQGDSVLFYSYAQGMEITFIPI